MGDKNTEEILIRLMETRGLGSPRGPAIPVSGGLMHRMYKIKTDRGLYAVKQLNRKVMARPGVFENFLRAEKLEEVLEREGIPIVPSLSIRGRKMQSIDNGYFYIFHWQEGSITDWNNISPGQCKIAGNILGRIHSISLENTGCSPLISSEIPWDEFAQRAADKNMELASLLCENEAILRYGENEMNKARSMLPDILCITNGDMDPKNVMWDKGKPWLIDLECLDYGNPVSDVLQLALQWSGIVTNTINTHALAAFFQGYLKAYDNGFKAYSQIFGLAYTWVEWLEYNVKRALGADSEDEAEAQLGLIETRKTIERIRYIRECEQEIKETLNREFFSV